MTKLALILLLSVACLAQDAAMGPPVPLDPPLYLVGQDRRGLWVTRATGQYPDGSLVGETSRNIRGTIPVARAGQLPPPPQPACPEDVNRDGVVDLADLNAVLAAFSGGCD